MTRADLVAAVAVAGVLWLPPILSSGGFVAGVPLALLTAAAVLLRHRHPVLSTVVAGAATIAGNALGVCQDPMLAASWCLYEVALTRSARTRTLVIVVAGLLAVLALVTAVPPDLGAAGARGVVAVAALAVAGLLGTLVGRQVEAARLSAHLETARDVHDVVGHALGVISAEAGVTRALPDADPEELRASLADIEQHARRALEEVQGLVRALRADGPALADLPAVVEATRAAGIRVEADLDLSVRLDERVGIVVFRIVQEALGNVVRHAPGTACTVSVRAAGRGVLVHVRDDGPAAPQSGSGYGLVGMRERARLVGGTVTWGSTPTGGFAVEARLPGRGVR